MIMQYTEAFYFAGTILEPKNQKWFVSNQYFWLEIRDAHILLFPAVLISQEPWNQRTMVPNPLNFWIGIGKKRKKEKKIKAVEKKQ